LENTAVREVGEVDADRVFQGSIRAVYDEHLGPLIFVTRESQAANALSVAIGYCQGTPMRNEIEAHDPDRLAEATEAAAAAITKQFGPGPVTGKIQAQIITALKNSCRPCGNSKT
jgi:hypothetical protein